MLYEHDEILYSGPSDPILAPHEEIFNVLRFVCLFSMVFGKNNLQFFEKNEKTYLLKFMKAEKEKSLHGALGPYVKEVMCKHRATPFAGS